VTSDWWWPWWWSSLFDVCVVLVAACVVWRSSKRAVRGVAVLVMLGAIVAAVLAPLVMKRSDDMRPMPEMPMTP
jgi:hypothetical protein